MKKNLNFLGAFCLALILSGIIFLGGCDTQKVDPSQADAIVSDMNLHPFMSGINQTSFGLQGQKLMSLQGYKQVLSELSFILYNSGMDHKQYEWFVTSPMPDTWFTSKADDARYVIGGDQGISREMIQQMMPSPKARHIMSTYQTSAGTKTVRIHKSVPSDWQTAISQAIIAWNGLGYGVKFTTVYTNAVSDLYNTAGEIDVEYQKKDHNGQKMSTSTYAITMFPSAEGKIGEQMNINSAYSTASSIVASAKKMIIAHELGHAVGISHTDSYDGFGLDVPVKGCGKGTTDPTSIMIKNGYDGMPWQGFSSCDKKVIDYYW
jgi:predicted Zn-dependent protease